MDIGSPSLNLSAFLEELQTLVLVINLAVGHNTTVLNATVAVRIYHADRGRAALLLVRLDILLPLVVVADPVDGVLPENSVWLVTVVDTEVDVISVEVAVRVSTLASGQASVLGLGLGGGYVNLE